MALDSLLVVGGGGVLGGSFTPKACGPGDLTPLLLHQRGVEAGRAAKTYSLTVYQVLMHNMHCCITQAGDRRLRNRLQGFMQQKTVHIA
ncbi:hypothetical protein FIBSPDRAFT_331300 [Athelia psychrophila]|uniref:Uncharacterized protein n=1 Tax=Athelia psychrophila TaxID=1759441 RepID=A0A167WG51_9AGAM|nr:hypothetical protein FIBSPDRAFT_331300 [Fibularhizoctonia sp. CBS 109695]